MTQQCTNPADRRPLRLRGFRWIRATAAALARAGISPNAISVVGLIAALAAGVLWALTGYLPEAERLLWLIGAFLVLVRVLANTVDGLVAVDWGKSSPVGLLYNDAPDRVSDTALLLGAGYAHGGVIELGYAAACVALFVSYVRLLGRVAGAPSDFSGPMDKGGRMIALLAAAIYMGLVPQAWQPGSGQWGAAALALLAICVGGAYTAARRLARAARYLNQAG